METIAKTKKQSLPQRLAISVAVSAALLSGYGSRQAFAGSCVGAAGTYTCSGAANNATDVTQVLNSGANPLTVTTTAGFGIDAAAGNALTLSSNGAGLSFTDNNESNISGATNGIFASNFSAGVLSITTNGTATGASAKGAGIYAFNNNGGSDLTINAAIVFGGAYGIRTGNDGTGATSITTSGTVTTGTTGIGIYAYNGLTTTKLTINSTDVSGDYTGIFAINNGTGATSITTSGTVTAATGRGIFANNSATTTDLIINTAAVFGNNAGIAVLNSGTGSTSITTAGTVTATAVNGYGLYALNTATTTGLTINTAAVSGGGNGIRAINTGTGATSITSTGSVTGATGSGIYARNTATATDITINAAAVSGDVSGIRVRNQGTGVTSITVSGAVTGGKGGKGGGTGIYISGNSGLSSFITLNSGAAVSSASGQAIEARAGDTTLTLNTGSSVTGRVILGAGDDTLNLAGGNIAGAQFDGGADTDTANISAGASVTVDLVNFENINLLGAGVVVGNKAITVDATAEGSRSVVLAGLTSSIHNLVSQRLAHKTTLTASTQGKSTGLSSGGMLFHERAPVAWAQVFGGTFDRDSEGGAVGYKTDHEGFALGYEWDNNSSRFGLMGGVAHSDTDSDINSFQTDVDSYFVGAYGHYNLGSVNLTASILGGYSDHDNKRYVLDNINGLEVANSDVSSLFLSPSLTLSSAFSATDKIELRPSATISYSIAWMDDYKEKGTTSSNLKVDDRTLETLTARLQLAAAYKIDQASEVELRAGVNSRHSDDESTHASILGTNFSYSSVGDDSNTGGFVGANIRMATMDNLSLVADVEYGKSSDEDTLTGSLSLNYTF